MKNLFAFLFMMPLLLLADAAPAAADAAKKSAELEMSALSPEQMEQAVKSFWSKENWEGILRSLGHELPRLCQVVIGFAVTLVVVYFFNLLFTRLAVRLIVRKTATQIDDILVEAIRPPINFILLVNGFYISLWPYWTLMEKPIQNLLFRILIALVAAAVTWALLRATKLVDYLLRRANLTINAEMDELFLRLINRTLKVTIAVLATFFIGQNILGLNISALIAGAGVVGLGVALASKDTVSNLFGSLMITMDKPFQIGDRVVVSGIEGIVENVGLRSTLIRELSGYAYTVPNSKIADVGIENRSRQSFLRHTFDLTLPGAARENIEAARKIVADAIGGYPFQYPGKPMRLHLNSYDNGTVNLQFVIIFKDPDLVKVQDYLEACNAKIIENLTAAGIQVKMTAMPNYLPY